jgi:hypothetical protein
MKKLLLLLAVAGMAAAGCRSDDDSNYNHGSGMNGGYQNQPANPQPGTSPNQNGNGYPPQ